MSNIKNKLDEIIDARKAQRRLLDDEMNWWKSSSNALDSAITTLADAESVNPDLAGLTPKLRSAAEKIRRLLADVANVQTRFSRDTLCIGIGGAARMGKSTFLQSVTGLEETQIPTSDKYFTTAVRSQIEHSPQDNIAIADFHSEESFIRKIIAPLCNAIKIPTPSNLSEFRQAKFALPPDEHRFQESEDVLKRLNDAQKYLDTYEKYLTGERGRRIPLDALRPFVAYPEGGLIKAGPFLAVSELVIRVKFPSIDVSRLRVIDLPGLGEAGVNLAKVQTDGMADVCDITFLVKRPTEANLQWTLIDSNALDAMSNAVPLLDDQTKFTAILANVGGVGEERARLCIQAIRGELKRPFEIIECNAVDRESVIRDTMPRILDFMARNIPIIDNALIQRFERDARNVKEAVSREIADVKTRICAVAPASKGDLDFGKELYDRTSEILSKIEELIKANSDGNDQEWEQEVDRIHGDVKRWVEDGCGYGSTEMLLDAISKNIREKRAQPADVINECRVKFRAQWEKMDLHLDSRIATLLSGIMDDLHGVLNDLVPERMNTTQPLEDVRNQIKAFADRIDARHSDTGDEEALLELSNPLRRIVDFDLQFRFHLEPMLYATTHLLIAAELPAVSEATQAQQFYEELKKKLLKAADDYALGLRKSALTQSSAFERKKRHLEEAIEDEATRADVIEMLEQIVKSAQSFCPKRIFAAVVETFADSFIRSKDSVKAFYILAREWRNELTPAPDEKTRLTNAAAGLLTELTKQFK